MPESFTVDEHCSFVKILIEVHLRLDENLFEELEIILVSPRDSREKVQSLLSGIYLKIEKQNFKCLDFFEY
jgi:hypothetical protein